MFNPKEGLTDKPHPLNSLALTRVSLQNWKSLQNIEVEFKPLTLLVGQNSVGKSSFIQSILAFCQWVGTGSKTAFPLNGDLVRMGKFSDTLTKIINHRDPNPITMTVALQLGTSSIQLNLEPGQSHSIADVSAFEAKMTSSKLSMIKSAQSRIIGVVFDSQIVETSYGQEWDADFSLEFGSLSEEVEITDLPKDISLVSGLSELSWTGSQRLDAVIAKKLEVVAAIMFNGSTRFATKPKFVSASDYLNKILDSCSPNSFDVDNQIFIAALDDEISKILKFVERNGPRSSSDLLFAIDDGRRLKNTFHEFSSYEFPDLRIVSEVSQGEIIEADFALSEDIFDEIRTFVLSLPWNFDIESSVDIDEDGNPKLTNSSETPMVRVGSSFNSLPWLSALKWEGDGLDLPTEINTPTSVLQSDLNAFAISIQSQISYLGPLRVNGFSSTLAGSLRNPVFPVGTSGEHTPLLLQELLEIGEVGNYPVFGMGIQSCTFREALESWFGLFTIPGASLQIVDLDKQGIQVQFASRSLDRYGTGASQVLPILALVLSRKPGDTVLIEQPELHLHPGGQQYLADLFMAISSMGVQVVLETHSEYIVNRIRRGAVLEIIQSETVQLVNFEQDGKGLARVQCVGLTESGGFADWPQGFFANTEEDLLDIIRALEDRETDL